MKYGHILQEKNTLLNRRWLLVLTGLTIQGVIIILLLLRTGQLAYPDVTLVPVKGNPTVCLVTNVNPFSQAWVQGLQAGTFVKEGQEPSQDGHLENCRVVDGNSAQIQAINLDHISLIHIYISQPAINLTNLILTILLTIIFNYAGISIYLHAQDRPTARITYSMFLCVSITFCLFVVQGFNLGWAEMLQIILVMITNGLSTTFVCLFPYPHNRQRGRQRASMQAYLPLDIEIGLIILSVPIFLLLPPLRLVVSSVVFSYNILCIIFTFWIMGWGLRKLDKDERKLARMVIISIGFLLILLALSLHVVNSNQLMRESILRLILIPLLTLPIICDYVLFHHQLLGTTRIIGRQVVRIVLWLLLACLFILPGLIFLHSLENAQSEINDYFYAAFLALSLWIFPWLWNKVRNIGDHIFYHDFYQYNQALGELSTALTSLQGLEQISAFLLPRLAQLLNATEIILFVRAISQDEIRYNTTPTDEGTRSWHVYQPGTPAGFPDERLIKITNNALEHLTQRSHEPLMLDSILLVALYDGDLVSGFLCLGAKKSREPYSRQDKSFLATLVAQLSLLEVNNRYLAQAQADAHKLAALNRRVIAAQEDERRHLALDLHDDVLQEAMLLVRDLSDASTMNDVADAMPLARSVVTNLRRTCLALRPSLLDELGLAEALRSLAAQNEQLGAGQMILELPYAGFVGVHFSTAIELAFYRVAQEALSNIVKHAQASIVIIRLRYDRLGNIILVIADNGDGFRMGQMSRESLGIVGMHERMRAIGGQVQLRTRPHHGTVVRAIYFRSTTKDRIC